MNKLILSPVIATSIATCAFLASHPMSPAASLASSERASIQAQADDSLLALRAGATSSASMDAAERAALQRAQSDNDNLLALRGGEMTNREWTIVGVVLLAVIVIVLIA